MKNKHMKQNIINYLEASILNSDLENAIMINDQRKLIYISLNGQKLENFLKDFDSGVSFDHTQILKLFYVYNDKVVFSEVVGDRYFIILIFDLEIKFGFAEYYLAAKVANFLNGVLADVIT